MSGSIETGGGLRLDWVDAASLQGAIHPKNWKRHPAEQVESIGGLLDEVGWAGALLFNERTGRLLDGHARRQLAASRCSGPVPVLVGSWTEEQENTILAYLDPTGWTAVSDKKKLTELLAGPMPSIQNAEMVRLMEAVKGSARLLDEPAADEAKEEDKAEVSLALDSIWPTDNPWSVPCLDPKLAADQVVFPVQTWGTVGARRPMTGTWHFFVHDHKFEPLWRRPYRVLWSRPAVVVEPNFSTTDQTPFALSLWHIYRKRWLARYWQSQGVKVLVDLNVDASLNAPHDAVQGRIPNLLGVPAGWKAFASRAHGNQPDRLVDEFKVAQQHAGESTPLFLVVGGGKKVQQLAQDHGWLWVPEQLQQRHGTGDPAADGPEETAADAA